jgi:hypothetical protein
LMEEGRGQPPYRATRRPGGGAVFSGFISFPSRPLPTF